MWLLVLKHLRYALEIEVVETEVDQLASGAQVVQETEVRIVSLLEHIEVLLHWVTQPVLQICSQEVIYLQNLDQYLVKGSGLCLAEGLTLICFHSGLNELAERVDEAPLH